MMADDRCSVLVAAELGLAQMLRSLLAENISDLHMRNNEMVGGCFVSVIGVVFSLRLK